MVATRTNQSPCFRTPTSDFSCGGLLDFFYAMKASAKWEEMLLKHREILMTIGAKRTALLERLRPFAPGMGASIPACDLANICESITEVDDSLIMPVQLKARRSFVTAWFEDNDDVRPTHQPPCSVSRLQWVRTSNTEELELERASDGLTADYHIQRSQRGYTIRANRTHCFVRPGFRFLCERGDHWVELEVIEDGERSVGHLGVACAQSAGPGHDAEESIFATPTAPNLEANDKTGSICRWLYQFKSTQANNAEHTL